MKIQVNGRSGYNYVGEHEDTGESVSIFSGSLEVGGILAYRVGGQPPVKLMVPPNGDFRVEVVEREVSE